MSKVFIVYIHVVVYIHDIVYIHAALVLSVQCCKRNQCKGKVTEVLATWGKPGFKSKGGLYFEGGVYSSIQNKASSHQVTSDSEQVCKPVEKSAPERGSSYLARQVGSRETKTHQQMETHNGPR